jgi:hypothetical protein
MLYASERPTYSFLVQTWLLSLSAAQCTLDTMCKNEEIKNYSRN